MFKPLGQTLWSFFYLSMVQPTTIILLGPLLWSDLTSDKADPAMFRTVGPYFSYLTTDMVEPATFIQLGQI